jgi:hypothetical protein
MYDMFFTIQNVLLYFLFLLLQMRFICVFEYVFQLKEMQLS